MDTLKCISTKLDVREFGEREVPKEVVDDVLEAGRLTGSGINRQHWHFVVVGTKTGLSSLAQNCPQGRWLEGADFAVIILTPRGGPSISSTQGGPFRTCSLRLGTPASLRGSRPSSLRTA
jgi:hypothetical protein